jgi:hypothetical protein
MTSAIGLPIARNGFIATGIIVFAACYAGPMDAAEPQANSFSQS